MDVADRIIDYIENNTGLNAIIQKGVLNEDKSAISFRPTPSSTLSRYVTGKTFEYAFQITVKDPNITVAEKVINDITNVLDGLGNGEITFDRHKLIRCEATTFPNFVEKTNHGEYVYAAIFVAELEGGY